MEAGENATRKRRFGTVITPNVEHLATSKRPKQSAFSGSCNFTAWSKEEVASFLQRNNFPATTVQTFTDNQIEGRHLLQLSVNDLKAMGITAVGVQKDIVNALCGLRTEEVTRKQKVFNDPTHGHIELHPLLVKIIDTPQFQRLRNIKQLGAAYYVFPGASHNRFEHSIGVCHLAGQLVETLQRKQPELGITDADILCVRMAGLCHDLGHGPFSHMFDMIFIPRVNPGSKWRHEQASVEMFDHMVEANGLKEEFERWGLGTNDITFVKEQIAGPLRPTLEEEEDQSPCSTRVWPYSGRSEEKGFLYEVVANKRNGIDVDKWDYFARDCYCLGMANNFDWRRYLAFARVLEVNNTKQICTRDKEVSNLYEMFHTRSSLHRKVYQHKTCKIVETMITEALVKANDHLLLPGKYGPVKMADAIHDMVAYTRLTDSVIQLILLSTDPNLKESQELLQKIEKRELYKCIGQTQPTAYIDWTDTTSIAREIVNSLTPDELDGLPPLTTDDIVICVITFDYGMKKDNPVDHVRFYMKDCPERAVTVRKDQVSQMLPHKFAEQQIHVYCKKRDHPSLKAAWKYFVSWCRTQKCVTPKGGEDMASKCREPGEEEEPGYTPYGTPLGTPAKPDPSVASQGDLDHDVVIKKLLFFQS